MVERQAVAEALSDEREMILRKSLIALGILAATTTGAFAQDARTVVAAASKVMGIEGLNSITMNGAGSNSNLGQMPSPGGPFVRNNASDYTRTIDFTQPALRASGVTFGVPIGGAVAVQGAFNQFITPMTPGGWAQQLNIWTTPWGFLKGAAANSASVKVQASPIRSSATSTIRISSKRSTPGSNTSCSATCWSKPFTVTTGTTMV